MASSGPGRRRRCAPRRTRSASADVARLLDALERERGAAPTARARRAALLEAAFRCDGGSVQALALAGDASGADGLGREGGLLVATAARALREPQIALDPACTT